MGKTSSSFARIIAEPVKRLDEMAVAINAGDRDGAFGRVMDVKKCEEMRVFAKKMANSALFQVQKACDCGQYHFAKLFIFI